MNCQPRLINLLLLKAFNKAGLDMVHRNFPHLSERIAESIPFGETVTADFLYRSLHLKAEKAEKERIEFIEIRREENLQKLTRYIGFSSYNDFLLAIERPVSSILQGCEGSWYYYVRESAKRDVILRSAVRIWEENKEFFIELCGGHRFFYGNIVLKAGGIFCILEDEDREKQLHLVFKIGISRNPELLQGVFSGFSTDGFPVAGKAFLLSQPQTEFKDLSSAKLDLKRLENIPPEWPEPIIRHLSVPSDIYIKVIADKGFDLDSLEEQSG